MIATIDAMLIAMAYEPIIPTELRPSSCPICSVPANLRHCGRCKWLACEECGVVWSARSGGWFATSDESMSGNTRRDARGRFIA